MQRGARRLGPNAPSSDSPQHHHQAAQLKSMSAAEGVGVERCCTSWFYWKVLVCSAIVERCCWSDSRVPGAATAGRKEHLAVTQVVLIWRV